MAPPTLVWLRSDLRLEDNFAFIAACNRGGPVIPVYILEPAEAAGGWALGGASRWWLHYSLEALAKSLEARGGRLILRQGLAAEVLPALMQESGAHALFWNRLYEPYAITRDAMLKSTLRQAGYEIQSFNAALLWEPWEVRTQQGHPFQVFTPFYHACLRLPVPQPGVLASGWPALLQWPDSLALEALNLLPRPDWAGGLRAHWQPGEAGAQAKLQLFLKKAWLNYQQGRDRPDWEGISRLSPHLHFGEISPRQIWQVLQQALANAQEAQARSEAQAYLRQIIWREFAHHLLFHFPHTPESPLRPAFAQFPWVEEPQAFRAWQRGQTGFPWIDAGMRELWHTGWMHNRVRMAVASFLVKDLRIHWLEGARWFWDTLVDADLANNTLGWQWTAGCGADAAPYFRVFNPVSQAQKFDPNGDYVRRWIPELAGLSAAWIHHPWEAPAEELLRAGIRLGSTYPWPLVDHAQARKKALEALASIKQPASLKPAKKRRSTHALHPKESKPG